ncbi:hypothetical protein J6590_046711 [Homalodisca vitripennis]|nr:hypothetical protein J6590_046711 [Homalodisca vitripennis]
MLLTPVGIYILRWPLHPDPTKLTARISTIVACQRAGHACLIEINNSHPVDNESGVACVSAWPNAISPVPCYTMGASWSQVVL